MFLVSLLFAVQCGEVLTRTKFDAKDYFEKLEVAEGKKLGEFHIHEKEVDGGKWVVGRAGDYVLSAYFHETKRHTVGIRSKGVVAPEKANWVEAGKWAVFCTKTENKRGNRPLYAIEGKKAEKPAVTPKKTQKPAVAPKKNGGNPDTVCDIAAGEIGYSMPNDPERGSKYGRWYESITGEPYYGENDVPYCAMFVSWVFNQAGASCAGLPGAYCPWIVTAGQNEGMAVSRESAQKGDVVLFDWSGCVDGEADHVGIVESNDGYSTMTCLEGNTDNGEVARKWRDYGYIICVIRPYYDSGSSSGGSSSGGSSSGGSSSGGSSGTATCVGDGVRIRAEPSYDGTILGLCYYGDVLSVDGQVSGEWVHVNCNGIDGWMHQDYVQ